MRNKRRVIAVLVALVLGLVGVLGATPARADEIDAVVPGSLTLTTWDGSTDPLHLWSEAKLSGEWRIPDSTAKKGDTFTATLPAEILPTVGGFGFEGADGTSFGDCIINGQQLTCTFNENVENRINVHGTFWLRSQVVKTSNANSLPITLANNQIVNVPLPNGQPNIGISNYLPTDIQKQGWVHNDNTLVWRIIVPGAKVADRSLVNIVDDYTIDGMAFTIAPGYPVAYSLNASAQCWNLMETPGCRTALDSTTTPKATIVVDQPGTAFTATLDNNGQNFAPDRIYVVDLRLETTGEIPVGAQYGNTAKIDGIDHTATAVRNVAGGGTGAGDGLGQISVNKRVVGNVPADTIFPVDYSYTTNGVLKTGTLDLKADGSAEVLRDLPNGTVVTLTERVPAVAGIDFGDPVFAGTGIADGVPDANSAQVTVKGSETIGVTLTNTASQHLGSFSITKNIEGSGAAMAPAEFTFNYTCAASFAGSVTVRAGQTVKVENVPVGECTVEEVDAKVDKTRLTTKFVVERAEVNGGRAAFTIEKNVDDAIGVVNAYEEIKTPSPAPSVMPPAPASSVQPSASPAEPSKAPKKTKRGLPKTGR